MVENYAINHHVDFRRLYCTSRPNLVDDISKDLEAEKR